MKSKHIANVKMRKVDAKKVLDNSASACIYHLREKKNCTPAYLLYFVEQILRHTFDPSLL